MIPSAQRSFAMCVRDRRVWCGSESEPIPTGRHPRLAAVALAERLAAGRPHSLRELNPWLYTLDIPPCASTPASGMQKSETVHP